MKKNVGLTIILTVLLIVGFAVPAMAQIYTTRTMTGFWYSGDVYHEKEYSVPGGWTSFIVEGIGTAQGNQKLRSTHEIVEGDNDGPDTVGDIKVNMNASYSGTTAQAAPDNRHMRIITTNQAGDHMYNTGVEMDPGETGFINQSAAYNKDEGGEYFKVDNHFGNTGGITKN